MSFASGNSGFYRASQPNRTEEGEISPLRFDKHEKSPKSVQQESVEIVDSGDSGSNCATE